MTGKLRRMFWIARLLRSLRAKVEGLDNAWKAKLEPHIWSLMGQPMKEAAAEFVELYNERTGPDVSVGQSKGTI